MSESVSTARFIANEEDGTQALNLLIDGMHCPSCVSVIESALKKQNEVTYARVNLSTKRLNLKWKGDAQLGDRLLELINKMGYRAVPFDPATSQTFEQREEKFLLRALAVAGFASGNLMLFSIPMWTSDGVEMGEATRTMFQWVQALIAMPAIAYAGMPFYRSAFLALREWRTNMDVPISVAVLLATGMSLFEVSHHGKHAYFDSSVMLLFFLLIGRYLDARARGTARGAAHDLLQMMTGSATVLHKNGRQETISLSDLREDMVLLVAAGEKIGADGEIMEGNSEIDASLITGETMPQPVTPGAKVFAGTINMSAPLRMRITKAGERSLIAEIVRLMEHAEQSQSRYVTIADQISGWYTPLVHTLAAITFLAWWLYLGTAWQVALLYAATVLIITCPCALGLAVPVVQVLASGILMRKGILLKSGSALERLAKITHAVFDKTGTLTLGVPELLDSASYLEKDLQLAASLAAQSKHPLSRAIARAWQEPLYKLDVKEVPGSGLEAEHEGKRVRLGKRSWCGPTTQSADTTLELWLNVEGQRPLRFTFADTLRDDAKPVIAALEKAKIKTLLLSGDRKEVVEATARELGIDGAYAALSPIRKCDMLEALKKQGARVLMVGDGLNDAPSLASAYVSMSPASAIDITQNVADVVFQGRHLAPVVIAWKIAKFSQVLVKQNFPLAALYNILAVPLAMAGMVTPLIAAIAMSSSSLIVIANAMRLNLQKVSL